MITETRTAYGQEKNEAWKNPVAPRVNGYRPEVHSNGNGHRNGHALVETMSTVRGLQEQLDGVDMIFVSPRGAAKRSDGSWTNARYSSVNYFPRGGGPLAGALRPVALEQLYKTGLLPRNVPILIPSGQHPQEGFVYHDLTKKELERRGIPSEQIITDSRSLDSVGEHGILLETCANNGYRNVVQITDKTQVTRQEMIDVLFRYASGNPPDEKLQEVINHIVQHPAMDSFSNIQQFTDLYEYTKERQIVEGMSGIDRQAELERLLLARDVANDREAFFSGISLEEMKLISKVYFDYHTKKYSSNGQELDWRTVVTPGVLSKIEEIGTTIALIPAEEVFKQTNGYLGRYARAVEESQPALRTLANEFAGIAQIRMFIYNAPSDKRNEVMNGFFNRDSTPEFLNANTKRFAEKASL